jgi:hypothetical protein
MDPDPHHWKVVHFNKVAGKKTIFSSFNPTFYTSRQYEETVGEPGEVIISSLYKEGEGQVFVLPATEGEQQQHHVEFVIPTTCEQVVEVEVEYPS